MNSENTFEYTYSAKDNQEVLAIRSKYLPRQESKLEELKRLDRTVQESGMTESLSVGITGCLVFGLGMCLAMEVIGSMPVLGVIVGILGAALMIPAYPVYKAIYNKTKEKLTPRILELANELSHQNEMR